MSKIFKFTLVGVSFFAFGFFMRGTFWLPVETRIVLQHAPALGSERLEPVVAVLKEPEIIEPSPVEAKFRRPAYQTPAEQILKLDQVASRNQRIQGLQNMVAEWIENDPALSVAEKESLQKAVQLSAQQSGRVPAEVLLTSVIGQLSSGEIRSAWKTAHLDSPMRAAIFSELIASELEELSPAELFETTDGWTPWERSRYSDAMLSTLAKTDLETAVQWGIGNPDAFGADAIRDLFVVYSKSDSQGLERALSQINDPRARASAIEALAARRVMNTEAALEWADSLPTSEEQSLAHDAIYEMTPRGIGVSVFSKDGFPEVGKVVRSENGLQRGDRIASISENGAEPVDTFGRSLGDIVDILRGEPGTTVTIQLLRSDSTSAEVQQVEKTIIREQLYFE